MTKHGPSREEIIAAGEARITAESLVGAEVIHSRERRPKAEMVIVAHMPAEWTEPLSAEADLRGVNPVELIRLIVGRHLGVETDEAPIMVTPGELHRALDVALDIARKRIAQADASSGKLSGTGESGSVG